MSEASRVWLLILCAGLGTFAYRASFILLFRQDKLPARIQAALRFTPPAIICALLVSIICFPSSPEAGLNLAKALALTVAATVSWRTQNVFMTIAVGMAVLWSVQALQLAL